MIDLSMSVVHGLVEVGPLWEHYLSLWHLQGCHHSHVTGHNVGDRPWADGRILVRHSVAVRCAITY